MPLASPDLDAAFEACRRETAEWAKTFYLGTLLLPFETVSYTHLTLPTKA